MSSPTLRTFRPEALASMGERPHCLCQTDPLRGCAEPVSASAAYRAGLKLFTLHAADGTPIMLTDSREAAIANAWSNELEALSVH